MFLFTILEDYEGHNSDYLDKLSNSHSCNVYLYQIFSGHHLYFILLYILFSCNLLFVLNISS